MKPAFHPLAAALLTLALATGCGRKSGDAHGRVEEKGDDRAEGGGVAFKEGRGLVLNPEVVRALGLKTAEAGERPLSTETKLLAHVFAHTPRVLASASVREADAGRFEKHPVAGATLVRIDRSSASATRRVDAIFALEFEPRPQVGEFVELVLGGETRTAIAVPESAILDAAAGTFVYVVNGESYLRTAVKLGAWSRGFVEVTDGLYSGDVVVATPVNQLWLAELRLTKGGGHSH